MNDPMLVWFLTCLPITYGQCYSNAEHKHMSLSQYQLCPTYLHQINAFQLIWILKQKLFKKYKFNSREKKHAYYSSMSDKICTQFLLSMFWMLPITLRVNSVVLGKSYNSYQILDSSTPKTSFVSFIMEAMINCNCDVIHWFYKCYLAQLSFSWYHSLNTIMILITWVTCRYI